MVSETFYAAMRFIFRFGFSERFFTFRGGVCFWGVSMGPLAVWGNLVLAPFYATHKSLSSSTRRHIILNWFRWAAKLLIKIHDNITFELKSVIKVN